MDETKRTVAEALDDAQTGEEFGAVLLGLFAAADAARDKAEAEWRCDLDDEEGEDA
jgi:hypothetical protein